MFLFKISFRDIFEVLFDGIFNIIVNIKYEVEYFLIWCVSRNVVFNMFYVYFEWFEGIFYIYWVGK